jgi:hypothetical protein
VQAVLGIIGLFGGREEGWVGVGVKIRGPRTVRVSFLFIYNTSIYPSSGRFEGRCKFVNRRFVGLWYVCRG